MMRIILFFMILPGYGLTQMTYQEFLYFDELARESTLSSDSISSSELESIVKKLTNDLDGKNIPYGLENILYSNLAEAYLERQNYELAFLNFQKAFEYPTSTIYIEWLRNKLVNNEEEINFFKKIELEYLLNKKPIDNALKKTLDNMYDSDQKSRLDLMNCNSCDSIEKVRLNTKMTENDRINQILWDSISEKYNWIDKNLVSNENRTIEIILYHSPLSMRNRYFIKGYELALMNKSNWIDIRELFCYSIYKELFLSQEKSVWLPEISNKIDEDYLFFVLHALTLGAKSNVNLQQENQNVIFDVNVLFKDKWKYKTAFKRVFRKMSKMGVSQDSSQFKINFNTKPKNELAEKGTIKLSYK